MAQRTSTRGAGANSSASAPPLRFGDDPLLWAAWLYYEEGLTQGEIATRMGVSRPSVNAYLADARTRGIVSIEIEGLSQSSKSPARLVSQRRT